MYEAQNKNGDDAIEKSPAVPESRKYQSLIRYRKSAAFVLIFYVFFLVLTWVLTCITSYRPLSASSYSNKYGLRRADIAKIRNWQIALDVPNSVATLITIPVLSALLAQAAIIFSQRRHANQFLSFHDLCRLADRKWTSAFALWDSVRPYSKKSSTIRNRRHTVPFLLAAVALILLGIIQQPLYQILVGTDTIAMTTCGDTYFSHLGKSVPCNKEEASTSLRSLGHDLEPSYMAGINHYAFLPRMASDLASFQSTIFSQTYGMINRRIVRCSQ